LGFIPPPYLECGRGFKTIFLVLPGLRDMLQDGKGGTVDPGSPRVVELISSGSTDAELADGSVDYVPSVNLSSVPFFGESGVLSLVFVLGMVWLFRRW